MPAQTEPHARPTRTARTSSGPNSLDARAINDPTQMAKMAVIFRVIIFKIPCVARDDEAAPASFPDDCVGEGNRFRSPRRYLPQAVPCVEMSRDEKPRPSWWLGAGFIPEGAPGWWRRNRETGAVRLTNSEENASAQPPLRGTLAERNSWNSGCARRRGPPIPETVPAWPP